MLFCPTHAVTFSVSYAFVVDNLRLCSMVPLVFAISIALSRLLYDCTVSITSQAIAIPAA